MFLLILVPRPKNPKDKLDVFVVMELSLAKLAMDNFVAISSKLDKNSDGIVPN